MGDSAEKENSLLSRHALAGVLSGFTGSLIMHPLDVVTTRMQAQDGRISKIPRYKNAFVALETIIKTEGFKALYAGIVPNLVGSTTNWGVYFFGYNYTRNMVRNYLNEGEELSRLSGARELGPVTNLLCATVTGCASAVITQPIWLAKTRMELQQSTDAQYKGMFHCLSSVLHQEGFSALFR